MSFTPTPPQLHTANQHEMQEPDRTPRVQVAVYNYMKLQVIKKKALQKLKEGGEVRSEDDIKAIKIPLLVNGKDQAAKNNV